MSADAKRATHLDRPVDPERDHVLGLPGAEITLVEYGSYVCGHCRVAHEVVRGLRERFGDRLRYVYRHLPLSDRHEATQAAELVEYATAIGGEFWEVHDALMSRGRAVAAAGIEATVAELGVPPRERWDPEIAAAADTRVREDARSGLRGGARVTPTFFINGRRYEGAWEETALGEALLRSLGHRLHAASLDFARWAPSTGLLLLLATAAALVVSNTAMGPAFLGFWETASGLRFGALDFVLPLLDWVNHGLLSLFFLVVGLEIKRELTVGRLASARAAAFPIAAALGGMVMPALLFALLAPPALRHGWGMTIATDTAFAVALIVVLGARVPVDLRVFLTAAVIVDDLVAIVVVALFYSAELSGAWLGVAAALTVALALLNHWRIYRALPYAVLGLGLWLALHEAGIHATLAGVVLAVVTPTRPPPNLRALLAHSQAVLVAEMRRVGDGGMRTFPSEPALRALDTIHDRMESPASKLLRAIEPWSSYLVLPVFALANAGVAWSPGVLDGHGRLVAAIVIALVVGKLVGIYAGARLAVAAGIGRKPASFTWRQLAGAAALAGIGFTMSLFIAAQAFTGADHAAAKIAIFIASALASVLGLALLVGSSCPDAEAAAADPGFPEQGTPVEKGTLARPANG